MAVVLMLIGLMVFNGVHGLLEFLNYDPYYFYNYVDNITVAVNEQFGDVSRNFSVIELCGSMKLSDEPRAYHGCLGVDGMESWNDFQFLRVVYTPNEDTSPVVFAFADRANS